MPRLAKLYETHADQRDRFEILAIHDTAAKTFEELDGKLEAVKTTVWKGKDLPFPVLLDSTGQTLKRYGISSFPTSVLIDPDGNLVRGGDVSTLEQALRRK